MYNLREKSESAADCLRESVLWERSRLDETRTELQLLQKNFKEQSAKLEASITRSEITIAAWEAAISQLDPAPDEQQAAA